MVKIHWMKTLPLSPMHWAVKVSRRKLSVTIFSMSSIQITAKPTQKRPIYWLFDSGKKNGFKALLYMHRYQPDTIARIRTDYVHEQQARYHSSDCRSGTAYCIRYNFGAGQTQ